MFLTYANGNKVEGFLLARTENQIRVAIPGAEDPMQLTNIHGTWISEDLEPVRVEFAWEGKSGEEVLSEADCICSHDLAARLLHLLWSGADADGWKIRNPMTQGVAATNRLSGLVE